MPIRLNGSTSGFTELSAPAVAGNNTLTLPSAGTVIATLIPGEVKWFAMTSAPSGFLKANGAAISRTTYANLFAAIGTTFGVGDGSTTFNVPDLRGEFIRGWDDGRGVDTSRTFGSAQADDLKSHTHTYIASYSDNTDKGGGGGRANTGTYTGNTGATGGTETRPRNIAILACIAF
jgi:microcystin-dependent protein